MRLILQPCGDKDGYEHYNDTIEKKVKFSDYKSLLPIISDLDLIFPEGEAAAWGVTLGDKGRNKKKWDKIQIGDVAAFSKSGRIFAVGTIALKFQSIDFAKDLWAQGRDGKIWECTYFLDEVKPFSMNYMEFNNIVGYEPGYVIQGFNVLDEEKSQLFIDTFDLASLTHVPNVTPDEFENAIDKFKDNESLERTIQSQARVEQSFLRKSLFRGSVASCCICSNKLPIEFLAAAHIKKRSACTREEKLDSTNIAMAACKFGCDELYERGYIAVSESGTILKSTKRLHTSHSKVFVDQLVGKTCSAFNENNRHYFQWHREHTFNS